MSCLRILVCLILPPLAVIDKGCGAFILVTLLTIIGWVPGVIAALIINARQLVFRQTSLFSKNGLQTEHFSFVEHRFPESVLNYNARQSLRYQLEVQDLAVQKMNQPLTPAITNPNRVPTFEQSSKGLSPKANPMMNNDIVKPIPASQPNP